MSVSFSPDPEGPFIANLDGTSYNFVIDVKTGLALPRNMAEGVVNTKKNVNNAMGAETEVKEVVSNVVELDSENYGAPPENSGIAAYKKGMDSPISSISEPQAWEDDHGNWFYNFAGALQLGKFLGRTLPNFDQFVATIKANPDNFSKSTGTRNGENGSFYGYDKLADFWTSVEDGANDAYFASFSLDNYNRIDVGGRGERDRNDGLFVRFIVDKK